MIKNRIGMIRVTITNTSGIVTIAAIQKSKPDKILIFIEINAKNEMSKQTIK